MIDRSHRSQALTLAHPPGLLAPCSWSQITNHSIAFLIVCYFFTHSENKEVEGSPDYGFSNWNVWLLLKCLVDEDHKALTAALAPTPGDRPIAQRLPPYLLCVQSAADPLSTPSTSTKLNNCGLKIIFQI